MTSDCPRLCLWKLAKCHKIGIIHVHEIRIDIYYLKIVEKFLKYRFIVNDITLRNDYDQQQKNISKH
jgi:hypothetical protein